MWIKNLKVLAVAVLVLGFYTGIAHIIPQVQSEVPKAIDPNAMTPEQLVGEGEKIFNGAGGCTACHGLGTRAPNLLTDEKGTGQIGARCGKREPGKDCKAYLYESLTEPQKFLVPGYGPIMPDMRRTLDNAQIWAAISFLESQGGNVDVTPDDIKATGGGGDKGGAAAAPAGGAAGGSTVTATTDPKKIIEEKGCLGCHKLGSEGGAVGPDLSKVGGRADKDYIRESIIDPDAKIAKGFEQFKGMMPKNFGEQLSAKQLEILVNFLASQK
jgi:mono/diheme cytochrome c family protein